MLGFSLAALFSSCSHVLADSAAVIRELRARNADVRWVTEGGILEGHPIPLRPEDYYYSVTIDGQWTGGNRGLAWLRDVSRLKVLQVGNASGVNDDGLAQMGKLPEVEELCLEHVNVSDKGLAFLSSMPRLRSLSLQYVSISDDALAALGKVTALESLNLGSLKHVGDKTVVALERLPRLRELTLAQTGVSDGGLQHLNRAIESLNLFETRVTDAGMKSLEPLTKLKHLDVTGTRVSDKGLAYLARLPELESLYVGRTAVTEAGVTAFLKGRGSGQPVKVLY